MKSRSNDGTWGPKWPLLFLPPLLLFLKDFIATNAVLATEPGITARTKMYLALSQLPGAFFFDDASGAMIFNQCLAFGVSGFVWFIASHRSCRRAAQEQAGPEQRFSCPSEFIGARR